MKILSVILILLITSALGIYYTFTGTQQASIEADMLQLGALAVHEKHYDDAFEWYQNAAYQGLAEGRYQLAKLYEGGLGTQQNDKMAAYWMALAAEQSLSKAEYEYGVMLEFGRGVDKAPPQVVVKQFQKSAVQGHPEGMAKMAHYTLAGLGVAQNDAQALEWALKAKDAGASKGELLLAQVIDKIRAKADSNDSDAQFLWGEMLLKGRGIAQDEKQAMDWLKKAASAGHAQAQFTYGSLLLDNNHPDQAMPWIAKAASQGLAIAGYTYAAMLPQSSDKQYFNVALRWLYHGVQVSHAASMYNLAIALDTHMYGLPDNNVDVQAWMQQAAQQGIAHAQNDLAVDFIIHKQNTTQAINWLKRAAGQDAKAAFNLGLIYARGEITQQDNDQAMLWWKKAQAQGLMEANAMVGLMYHLGYGVSRDEKEALRWYEQAGDDDAMPIYNAAMIYYRGVTLPPDYKRAAEKLQHLCEQGDVKAQNLYASMLLNRSNEIFEPELGLKWLHRAATAGYVEAMFNLATVYRSGLGTPQNDRAAFEWYKKSAELDFAPAQNALGYLYAEGRGIKADDNQARYWFQKASNQGLAIATSNLKNMKPQASFSLLTLQIDQSLHSSILTDTKLNITPYLLTHHQPVY